MPDPHRLARKRALTTGDVAALCHVSPRTACKWVDSGALPGFRVASQRARRVARADLVAFAAAHGIPLDWTLGTGPAAASPASTLVALVGWLRTVRLSGRAARERDRWLVAADAAIEGDVRRASA